FLCGSVPQWLKTLNLTSENTGTQGRTHPTDDGSRKDFHNLSRNYGLHPIVRKRTEHRLPPTLTKSMAVFVGTPELRKSHPPLSETEVLNAKAQPTKSLAAKRFLPAR